MEELLIGVANAIGSHNEDEFNSYISPKYRNHKTYGYKAIHKEFIEALPVFNESDVFNDSVQAVIDNAWDYFEFTENGG